MDERLAEKFYGEHKGRFFYKHLISFMCSSPSEVLVLERVNAINKWRELLGPTKVFKAVYSKYKMRTETILLRILFI